MMQQKQQQPYNSYYGNYNYQPSPRNIPIENRSYESRWMYGMGQQQNIPQNMQHNIPQMPQSMPQNVVQPQIYNPLNPMSSKFIVPQNPMYKNTMMSGQTQPLPQPVRGVINPLTGQYYRPNESVYDPRYGGNYPQ